MNVKIYTRSMNDVLYHKAMALCDLPYEKVRLLGTSADGYLYQVVQDSDADWVINIDEDAFVCDLDAMKRLIDYCMENGYDNCGMPDGGVVHLRDGNPLVTNPYLNILNTKAIRKQFDISKLSESPNQTRFSQTDLLVGAHDFSATNVEPYYQLFIWMSNHFKTLYLKATNHPDGESTVLYNHIGEEMLIHTWYSRYYNNNQFHTQRIDNAFKEACRKQGVRVPMFDKCILFDPHALVEINYKPGAHECHPWGRVKKYRNEDFKLLHYKNIGLVQLLERNQSYVMRLSKENIENNYGIEYLKKEQFIIQEFDENEQKAEEII